jgi:hypothetical protein
MTNNRFDKQLFDYEKKIERECEPSLLESEAEAQAQAAHQHELILDELRSHFYYICGSLLLLLRHRRHESSQRDIIRLAQLCYAISSLISKPNSEAYKQYLQRSSTSAASKQHCLRTDMDDWQSTRLMLLKLAHRSSAWRYSMLGNWLRHAAYCWSGGMDQLKLIGELRSLGGDDGDGDGDSRCKKRILEAFGNVYASLAAADRSYLMSSTRVNFSIDPGKLYVLDELTLDYADKSKQLSFVKLGSIIISISNINNSDNNNNNNNNNNKTTIS